MFGGKFRDRTKEFEQTRQAGRYIGQRTQGDTTPSTTDGAPAAGQEVRPASNITVTPIQQPTDAKAAGTVLEGFSSIISTGSAWNGNLKIEGSVRVDGHLSGEVDAKGLVLVSEGAEVDAKVRAAFVVIAGSFKGQAECSERLEVMSTGWATAELATKSLVVHEGAFIEGHVRLSGGHVRISGEKASATAAQSARPDGAAADPAKTAVAVPPPATPAA